MQSRRDLSAPGAVALCLTLAASSALLFLEWVVDTRPQSLGGRIAAQMMQLIGHSGQLWLLLSIAAFVLPVGVAIMALRQSRFGWVLLRFSGIASTTAMSLCYWPRRLNNVIGAFLVVLSALMIVMAFMHLAGQFLHRQSLGLVVLVVYFGLFAWILQRVIFVPEVLLVPGFGLVSSVIWARDVVRSQRG